VTLAQALFTPRAVALVGASGDAGKNAARPMRFLRRHGYSGRIVPVNATRAEVLGERAWKSLAEAPGEIDHAYVLTPSESVEDALEDCGARGVKVVTVLAGGFADSGREGAARQGRLVARARALGMRLLGPNSMGLIDVPGRVALSGYAVLEMESLPAGTTSFVSQSGTMLGTVLSRGAARGLGFSKLVSVGNEADLGVAELVELLAEDTSTQVILLFLETLREAARLSRRRAKRTRPESRWSRTSSAARAWGSPRALAHGSARGRGCRSERFFPRQRHCEGGHARNAPGNRAAARRPRASGMLPRSAGRRGDDHRRRGGERGRSHGHAGTGSDHPR
jgi:predicted CoA-binding protein